MVVKEEQKKNLFHFCHLDPCVYLNMHTSIQRLSIMNGYEKIDKWTVNRKEIWREKKGSSGKKKRRIVWNSQTEQIKTIKKKSQKNSRKKSVSAIAPAHSNIRTNQTNKQTTMNQRAERPNVKFYRKFWNVFCR